MSDITYNQYGYRIGPAIRLAEEGYAIGDLEVFNDPVVPAFTLANSADYFKIPGRLRMWSAREKYYEGIEDLDESDLTLEYSMRAFEPNPYRGSFTNLYRPLKTVAMVTWDNSNYAEPVDCVHTEYPRGFMRSPVPTIQFIVDTASINKYFSIINGLTEAIEAVIDELKLRVEVSVNDNSPCLTITSTEGELGIDYELALNIDLAQYLELPSNGLVLEEVSPDSSGCGPKYKLVTNASCASFLSGVIMLATPEGGVDFLCPPTEGGLFALTWNNAGLVWMPVESCEETSPPA